ncbi:uncharacterized protein BJ212DRAFT_1331979 [Suillus subaureus]|uniref:Uncharacterized protein n=1 Tax=Suillus subaureus TaxID=48587 RepID=A0A9P7JG98_9AGAM|nr:uncharacterized protein BJ212DRAFT_1331979 [Suillus subaureus]KAG1821556.1 hypothetical protein BJ212DRAFT_1331979 [Suillus subaureus]
MGNIQQPQLLGPLIGVVSEQNKDWWLGYARGRWEALFRISSNYVEKILDASALPRAVVTTVKNSYRLLYEWDR